MIDIFEYIGFGLTNWEDKITPYLGTDHYFTPLYRGLIIYLSLLLKWLPLNLGLYAFCHGVLSGLSAQYRKFEGARQLYILKNLSKSLILCYLVSLLWDNCVAVITQGVWPPNEKLYQLGVAYVVTDVTGLLLVKLALRTKIHHVCVLFFGLYNVMSDYQQPGIHRALIYLTYLSMAAYLVNTYLALRFLISPASRRFLATSAMAIYVISVFLNFIVQHHFIWTSIIEGPALGEGVVRFFAQNFVYLYAIMYWLILADDIILLRYLFNNSLCVNEEKEKME